MVNLDLIQQSYLLPSVWLSCTQQTLRGKWTWNKKKFNDIKSNSLNATGMYICTWSLFPLSANGEFICLHHIWLSHLIRYTTPPMDDRAICLPWNKNCVDIPRTDGSLWRITYNLLKFTKGIQRRGSATLWSIAISLGLTRSWFGQGLPNTKLFVKRRKQTASSLHFKQFISTLHDLAK